MIITTAGRTSIGQKTTAKQLSQTYQIPFKERNGISVKTLKEKYQSDIVVVGKEGLYISPLQGDEKLFFHPNLAMVRVKRLMNGEEDPLIATAGLEEGMSFLDCTLGLASDSIIASFVVGDKGVITGIEGNPALYLLAKEGLATFSSGEKRLDATMRRVNVVHQEHSSFLLQAKSNSYDVVYFDPMFQSAIDTSSGINSIRQQALTIDITPKVLAEAKRVAKKRVILKDHWKSERFLKLGFTQHKRKTALFHYGTIEVD